MLQQNCFEDTCRTGVLKGGKVEDMGADMDCYKEFCKSTEGIRSNACNTGQVRSPPMAMVAGKQAQMAITHMVMAM